MTGSGRLAMMAAGIIVMSSAGPAFADPTPADRETARSLMQEGRDLRDKGDTENALKRFKAANDIMRVPTTALEVARTEASLGLLVEARDTIASIRKIPLLTTDPEPFVLARAKADDLDVSLEGLIPTLTIVFDAKIESEAGIAIDGVPILRSSMGLPRRIDPGHHQIVAKTVLGEGTQDVDLAAGEQKQIFLRMDGIRPVFSTRAETPPAPGPTPETPLAPPVSHAPTAVAWAGIGVAAAGVVAGSIFGVLSASGRSSLTPECPGTVCPPGQPSNDLDSANLEATISTVSFAVAGVGAAVAITSILIGHSSKGAPGARSGQAVAARIDPWIGVGALGVRGQF